jgi:hypothetical protein
LPWCQISIIIKQKQWLMPVILTTQEATIRRIVVCSQPQESSLWDHETLSWKYPTQKMAGGVAHVVELLPSKCKALSSNSSTTKIKQNLLLFFLTPTFSDPSQLLFKVIRIWEIWYSDDISFSKFSHSMFRFQGLHFLKGFQKHITFLLQLSANVCNNLGNATTILPVFKALQYHTRELAFGLQHLHPFSTLSVKSNDSLLILF